MRVFTFESLFPLNSTTLVRKYTTDEIEEDALLEQSNDEATLESSIEDSCSKISNDADGKTSMRDGY